MRAAAAGVALWLATATAWASPRSDLARDLVAFLKANGVQVTVTKQTETDLELAIGASKPQIALENIERYVSDAVAGGMSAAEARRQVFGKYLESIKGFDHPKMTLARDGALVMPRLVPIGYLPSEGGVVHAGKIGDTGLELTYVADAEGSVRYLTATDVKDLGIAADALRALALKNLARTWPVGEIRKVIADTGMTMVRKMDSFDATRLLLVQSALKKGESVAALAPDRDMLVIGPAPADGDWSKLREAAKAQLGTHPLLTRPLLITPDKIEAR